MYQSAKELVNKARKGITHVIDNTTGQVVAVGTALTTATGLAHAELPAAVGTTFTEITANINAIFSLAFPVVALGLGLMVVIKLFKRFGNKV